MAASKERFEVISRSGGQPTLIPPVSKYVDNMVLAADVAETITVPSGVNIAIFNGTVDFYVNFEGSTAIVPTTEIADGTGHELNPGARAVDETATYSVISAATCIISIAYYA